MIDGGSTSGLELLLSAMVTVRSALGDARLRVISQARPEVRDAPPWMEWSMAARGELPLLLGPARACVIPRGLNPYSDLAVPLKLMDYLSFGKPIIATDAAETASILERSGAGLVVDETPDALAAAIERVLSEPGLADRLASRARAFATLPGSTWDARASKILEHLVGSPRSGR
jgi:glycosyltransferase involved in cell wall biosynthesis